MPQNKSVPFAVWVAVSFAAGMVLTLVLVFLAGRGKTLQSRSTQAASSREVKVCQKIIAGMNVPPSYQDAYMEMCLNEIENSLD